MRSVLLSVFLAAAFALSSPAEEGKLRVVSDIDDTLKITHTQSPIDGTWSEIFSLRAFTGMSDVFRALRDSHPGLSFTYISGNPALLRFRVHKFLRENDYPEGGVVMRAAPGERSSRDFKRRTIVSLLENTSDRLILFGDDAGDDPELFYDLFLTYESRIADIYIRKIQTGRRHPPAVFPFMTAFDIARLEADFGRIPDEAALSVGDALLAEKRDERILPDFQRCPDPADLPWKRNRSSELETMSKRIDARIARICERRAVAGAGESR